MKINSIYSIFFNPHYRASLFFSDSMLVSLYDICFHKFPLSFYLFAYLAIHNLGLIKKKKINDVKLKCNIKICGDDLERPLRFFVELHKIFEDSLYYLKDFSILQNLNFCFIFV